MKASIKFIDFKEQYDWLRVDMLTAMTNLFESQHFILGEHVRNFEKSFAELCGTKYCVAVSSGTDAILAALMAIGVGPGDEVIVPDFTFFATAGTVARLFAKPVFVDVKHDTYCIDPMAIEKAITPKTKAIIPVHIFGQCADMEPIMAIAKAHNIPVIEDAAQGVCTQYKDGARAGSFGVMGCFSFYPTKNLGCYGDAGAVTTNDEEIYTKLLQMRNHGMEPKYYHSFIGGNFRMDEIQAMVLNTKLSYLENWNSLRRLNHTFYRKYFIDSNIVDNDERNMLSEKNSLIMPHKEYYNAGVTDYHTFHQYTILVEHRNELKEFLTKHQRGSEVYYPVPLHKQPCFEQFAYNDSDFPNTNYLCEHVLSLPIYPELTEPDILAVAETVIKYFDPNHRTYYL
jgi:dTDP-4-amino-4,6-dideoxygalactose transaminase